jgi:hypothetical protein
MLPVLIAVVMLALCNVAAAQSTGATQIFNYSSFNNSNTLSTASPTANGTLVVLGQQSTLSGSAINIFGGGAHSGGKAWYGNQVNIQSFTSDFTFTPPSGVSIPGAIGIIFGVQASNSTTDPSPVPTYGVQAGGDANMAGYGAYWYPTSPMQSAIGNSVVIKFDMNNANDNTTAYPAGGSPNSTGLYIDAGPSASLVPQDDLNPSGINFYSGHSMAAHIVYDGALLTMTLRDTVTNAQVRMNWPINIPLIVGGNTAWVGFAGGKAGTNSGSADWLIDTWSFSQGYAPRLATPTFSVAAGSYTSAQTVTLSGPSGATIYYTTNGRQPTTSSTQYAGPITVSANTFLQAIAVQSGHTDSLVGAANYQIQAAGLPVINFPSGFASASNLMSLVGTAIYNGSAIELTNTAASIPGQSGAAWYVAPVNVQSFTTTFVFSPGNNPGGSAGLTFCIQNQPPSSDERYDNAPAAAGDGVLRWVSGGTTTMANGAGGMGYSGGTGSAASQITGFTRSVAVKFDPVYGNGSNTGLYTNGADVSQNSIDMSSSGVNLQANPTHLFSVTLTYNGTTLSMTIADTTTNASFSHSWTTNIPSTVGANTAYVGFTAGSYYNVNRPITSWTYSTSGQTSGQTPPVPMAPGNFTVH